MLFRSIGMPALVAVAHHKGICCDRLANPPIIDQLAAGLMPTAEKRIGRSADQQPLLLGQIQHGLCLFALYGQRLFVVHALAGLQRLQRDAAVRLGHRQVDNDFNRLVSQKLFNRAGTRYVKLFRSLFGALAIQVGAGSYFNIAKGLAGL